MGRSPRTPPSAAGPSLDNPPVMADMAPITGELQLQVMSAVWRLGRGNVEQIRTELPARYRGAYTTIQTVLNRLADRGLLSRRKAGNAIEYRPKLSEAEYLSRSIAHTLAGASTDARQAALAQLIGNLREDEVADLRRLARQMSGRRRRR
jgi:predicted transcriptional regulator